MRNLPLGKNDVLDEPSGSGTEKKDDDSTRTAELKKAADERSQHDQHSSPSSLGSALRNPQDTRINPTQGFPIWQGIDRQYVRDGFKGWWVLFTIFSVSIIFPYVQSYWDNYRSGFVQRVYNNFNATKCEFHGDGDLDSASWCLAKHETKLLNEEHINRLVRTLHLIITEDGCRNLDRHNTVIHITDARPVIDEDIVYDGLMRYFNYTTDDARLLIRTCKIVFQRSYQDDIVSLHLGDQFIYMNDSLMKYCGFKIDLIGCFSDFCVFLVLFFLVCLIYLPIRKIVDSCKLKLLSKCQTTFAPMSNENTSSLTGVTS